MKIIRLKKGDLIIEKLTTLVNKEGSAGVFWGIGALEWAKLKHYNLKTKKYSDIRIGGPLEIVNLTGVIARNPDKKFGLHAHATVADQEFKTYGGHLEEAQVAATLEIVYLLSDQDISRYFDRQIGLNLLKT